MTVFKATRADMACTMGRGTFQYQVGVPAVADGSKCGSTGLHACEYVLDCIGYYGLGSGNRFFLAEAEGDIAEDGADTRIACTRLTLKEELHSRDIAFHAMSYMLRHPRRGGWEASRHMVEVNEDRAEMPVPGGIAIARGRNPIAWGAPGACLGLVQELDGEICHARLLTVGNGGIKPGVWYGLKDGEPTEMLLLRVPGKGAADEI